MENSLSRELLVPELLNKFSGFCGTRKFSTVCTTARHLSLSWARWIQSMPFHPVSLKSVVMCHLRLGRPRCHFPSRFSTTNLYALLYILSLIIIVWLYFLKNKLLKLLAGLVFYSTIVSQRRHICNRWRTNGSGGQSPVSHRGGLGSIPRQSMWDLW